MLTNKKALIVGLASERSIAYGIAKMFNANGAKLAFSYQDRFKDRVINIAQQDFNSSITFPCDVTDDEQINKMFDYIKEQWSDLDIIVHAVAFAPTIQFDDDYLKVINRNDFKIANDISSYSFVALAKYGLPILNQNGALLTLSYLGAERVVPNYNVMGVAKASLEANVRYLANSLGKYNIRVNAISAGAIKTLASSGIKDFKKMLALSEKSTPLPNHLTTEQVGNVATFLCSDLANAITGEIIHVDNGMHILAFPTLAE